MVLGIQGICKQSASTIQKAQIKRIRLAKGRAAVVRSVDDVKRILKELDEDEDEDDEDDPKERQDA